MPTAAFPPTLHTSASPPAFAPGGQNVVLELSAVIVAVTDDEPRVLVVQDGMALPSGPLEPDHRTLELGLRAWVERQTGQKLGYVEQLYTFADRDRIAADGNVRGISLSYLALAREAPVAAAPAATWQNWYAYFPWEDRRNPENALLNDELMPRLAAWASSAKERSIERDRLQRIKATFGEAAGHQAGKTGRGWNEDLILQRFELLYEASLISEARRHEEWGDAIPFGGRAMLHDHRRILATGIARLRAKLKYRPVVFELMPDSFTLSQLQRAVESLAGRALHTQNFRRFIQQQNLVEETGQRIVGTGGRPAKLMRFRRELLAERAASGTKLPLMRSG